jgi:hypothetical protein
LDENGIGYVSGKGMIACPTSEFARARAALEAGDERALKATGCRALEPGSRLSIIDGHAAWKYAIPPRAESETSWRVKVRVDGGRDIGAHVEPQYSAIAPEFLAMPAVVYLNMVIFFEDEAQTREFMADFEAVNGPLASRVTLRVGRDLGPFESVKDRDKFWSVTARGLTAGEAVNWCGQIRIARLYGICAVKIE